MVEFCDIEREIERRIVKGLRSIFEKDTRFVYNNNQKETELLITVDYPDNVEQAEKVPHAIITGITLQNNTQNFFGYNFFKQSNHDGINNIDEYAYVIPYSLTIICSGQQNLSKELASRVHWYISFAASYYLNETLGLQINEIAKGATSPSKQYPIKIFDTPIQIRGTYYWVGSKGSENLLNDIDKPLKNVKVNFNN